MLAKLVYKSKVILGIVKDQFIGVSPYEFPNREKLTFTLFTTNINISK